MDVPSPVYRLASEFPYSMDLVQEIDTHGARDCEHLEIPGTAMALSAIANFGGDVLLHPLLNSSNPVETKPEAVVALGVTSPTALTSFFH